MTVSMAALLRLFLYSFLFGLFIGLFYSLFHVAASFLRTLDMPLSADRIASLPERVRREIREKRKGKTVKGAYFFVSFFGQTFFCLLTAVALSVFYYCFNDGIPRLFSLFTVLLGFLLFQKAAGRLLSRMTDRLTALLHLLVLYVLAYFVRPPLLGLCWLARRVARGLLAAGGRFLSACRFVSSPIRMKRYMKKELSLLTRSAFLEELSD